MAKEAKLAFATRLGGQAREAVNDRLKDSRVIDSRHETDTLRLWESYRDQALLWRSLTLLQIPTTLGALVFCVILWHTRAITLNVPRQPLPGMYSAQQIPDEKYIEAATDFINLIATYQPASARAQFQKSREMLKQPLLDRFEVEMLGAELKAIENTSRTQVFFVDPTKTKIERNDHEVLVQMDGERLKIVAGKELPAVMSRYIVAMSVVPRNALNPYGIVIHNLLFDTTKAQN